RDRLEHAIGGGRTVAVRAGSAAVHLGGTGPADVGDHDIGRKVSVEVVEVPVETTVAEVVAAVGRGHNQYHAVVVTGLPGLPVALVARRDREHRLPAGSVVPCRDDHHRPQAVARAGDRDEYARQQVSTALEPCDLQVTLCRVGQAPGCRFAVRGDCGDGEGLRAPGDERRVHG